MTTEQVSTPAGLSPWATQIAMLPVRRNPLEGSEELGRSSLQRSINLSRGEKTRQKILDCLQSEHSVRQIEALTGLTNSQVRKQLKELELMGLITRCKPCGGYAYWKAKEEK